MSKIYKNEKEFIKKLIILLSPFSNDYEQINMPKEILDSYFEWLMNKLIQMGYDEKEVLDFVEKDYYKVVREEIQKHGARKNKISTIIISIFTLLAIVLGVLNDDVSSFKIEGIIVILLLFVLPSIVLLIKAINSKGMDKESKENMIKELKSSNHSEKVKIFEKYYTDL